MSNNAAECAIRGIAVGRRNWTFADPTPAAIGPRPSNTLIETCRLNNVDPRAWLADILARLPGQPDKQIDQPRLWNWKTAQVAIIAAAA